MTKDTLHVIWGLILVVLLFASLVYIRIKNYVGGDIYTANIMYGLLWVFIALLALYTVLWKRVYDENIRYSLPIYDSIYTENFDHFEHRVYKDVPNNRNSIYEYQY